MRYCNLTYRAEFYHLDITCIMIMNEMALILSGCVILLINPSY
jgi:hypothetical protein